MFRTVARLSRRARTTPRRSPETSVTPALCIATSVPVPMAMPTSARASAGASFTPSPAIATTAPVFWSSATSAAFPCGSTPACTSEMPRLRATDCAVAAWSRSR